MCDPVNKFSGELAHLLSKGKGDDSNVICSPISVSSVLAMALAGAKGETAAQIRKACRFHEKDEETFKAFKCELFLYDVIIIA